MPPPLIFNPDELDFEHPVAGIEEIRRAIPQRYEMEQLTAIVKLDPVECLIVGYKDVRDDEFWVRGHIPGFPLMPGVLMCEAGAQLCSYFMVTQGYSTGDFVAFGGMDRVKFRGTVRPGDRFIIGGKAVEIRVGRRAIFTCQGVVNGQIVFHGDLIGVPFDMKRSRQPSVEQAGELGSC